MDDLGLDNLLYGFADDCALLMALLAVTELQLAASVPSPPPPCDWPISFIAGTTFSSMFPAGWEPPNSAVYVGELCRENCPAYCEGAPTGSSLAPSCVDLDDLGFNGALLASDVPVDTEDCASIVSALLTVVAPGISPCTVTLVLFEIQVPNWQIPLEGATELGDLCGGTCHGHLERCQYQPREPPLPPSPPPPPPSSPLPPIAPNGRLVFDEDGLFAATNDTSVEDIILMPRETPYELREPLTIANGRTLRMRALGSGRVTLASTNALSEKIGSSNYYQYQYATPTSRRHLAANDYASPVSTSSASWSIVDELKPVALVNVHHASVRRKWSRTHGLVSAEVGAGCRVWGTGYRAKVGNAHDGLSPSPSPLPLRSSHITLTHTLTLTRSSPLKASSSMVRLERASRLSSQSPRT